MTVGRQTQQVIEALYSVDPQLRQTQEIAEVLHSVDPHFRQTQEIAEVLHSVISFGRQTQLVVEVLLKSFNTITIVHTTDALLQAVDTSLVHTTDAALKAIDTALVHTTDALLQAVDTSLVHTTDAVLQAVDTSLVHTTDAVLQAVDTALIHTTDALLQAVDTVIIHTTDTSLHAIDLTAIHTTDTNLQAIDLVIIHSTDTLLQPVFFSTAAVLVLIFDGFCFVTETNPHPDVPPEFHTKGIFLPNVEVQAELVFSNFCFITSTNPGNLGPGPPTPSDPGIDPKHYTRGTATPPSDLFKIDCKAIACINKNQVLIPKWQWGRDGVLGCDRPLTPFRCIVIGDKCPEIFGLANKLEIFREAGIPQKFPSPTAGSFAAKEIEALAAEEARAERARVNAEQRRLNRITPQSYIEPQTGKPKKKRRRRH